MKPVSAKDFPLIDHNLKQMMYCIFNAGGQTCRAMFRQYISPGAAEGRQPVRQMQKV